MKKNRNKKKIGLDFLILCSLYMISGLLAVFGPENIILGLLLLANLVFIPGLYIMEVYHFDIKPTTQGSLRYFVILLGIVIIIRIFSTVIFPNYFIPFELAVYTILITFIITRILVIIRQNIIQLIKEGTP